MFIFIILLAVITLYSTRCRSDESDILSKDDTMIINGLFVICIFLSHGSQYITLNDDLLNNLYLKFQSFLGQLVVATFLSFSGYGVSNKINGGDSIFLSIQNSEY